MAFAVQSDAGDVADANAYIDVAFFRGFHLDRGRSYSKTDIEVQAAIVKATDFIDTRYRFSGSRYADGQTTQFPRNEDGLPLGVKQACALYAAIALTTGTLFLASPTPDASGRRVKEKLEKVGPILEKVVYDDSLILRHPEYPEADSKIRATGVIASKELLRW